MTMTMTIYIICIVYYVYNIRHIFINVPGRVHGHRVGFGREVGTPPPSFGAGKHKNAAFRSELDGY